LQPNWCRVVHVVTWRPSGIRVTDAGIYSTLQSMRKKPTSSKLP